MALPKSPSQNHTTERSPLLATSAVAVQVDERSDDESDAVDKPVHCARQELRELLELVYPVVTTTALEFMPGFTSIVLAGHLNSPLTKEYVDASTLSTMFTNISGYSIGFGLASALDTLCSQAYGAKRYDKIGVYFQCGLIVIGACLLPIAIMNWYSAQFLLYLGQDPTVSVLAQEFSRYNLIGVPFVFLYELQRKVLQAQGIMTPLVFIAALGNVVHILSGYVLAYHTSWGFAGIALSRSIGNISLPMFLWIYFRKHPQHLTQWWAGWSLTAALEHVGLFLRLGIPGMIMMVMEWWAFEILSLMAGVLPDSVVAVSAQSVQLNTVSMMYMVFLGFSVAANIRVGNHLGADRPARARLVGVIVIKLVGALGLLFGVLVFVARSAIPRLFVNDPVTVERAARVLFAWAPFEVVEGLNCVMQGIFRGAGMQEMAARTNAVTFYGVGVPLAYALAFRAQWGVEGLWMGFGTGVSLSALALIAAFSRWDWRALAHAAQSRTAE